MNFVKRDAMRTNAKKKLLRTLRNFLLEEVDAEAEYEKAIELANDVGLSEVMVGLMQIKKDSKNHRDALGLMLLGIESE
ncbi:hypothetical protein MUP77_04665 [Candidatus Bathyarchaeota archaeon]|nr:hypothetical protein [Candidatus Bathyarchaeota archaeon]